MKHLEHLRRYPLLQRDEERIRVRAYYHHRNGTHAGDAVADWLRAEREELESLASTWLLDQGRVKEFEEAYEAPVSHLATIGERCVTWIGTRHPRRCALCTEPSPTFKTDAHLLAESFGNRSLFSLDECDECNLRNGRELEDHLAKMFLGDRVLGQQTKLVLDGTLTTPNPGKPEQLIAYRVSGGDIPGTLTIVSRDRCRTWNCELAMDVTPKAIEILRLLERGAAMTIVDAGGRQIYPIGRGWIPSWKSDR